MNFWLLLPLGHLDSCDVATLRRSPEVQAGIIFDEPGEEGLLGKCTEERWKEKKVVRCHGDGIHSASRCGVAARWSYMTGLRGIQLPLH